MQISGPGDDLPPGQPAASGAAQTGAHQEPSAWTLGIKPGAGLHLYPPEPHHQSVCPELDLQGRSRAWGTRGVGAGLSGGTYSEIYTDKSEDEEGLRAFFKQFSFPGG